MSFVSLNNVFLQPVLLDITYPIKLSILRLDLIDEYISGNKWFKLKYNIAQAQEQHKKTILTFGGAYSNHIAATARACMIYGFNSIGVIRGEPCNNHTLKKAQEHGMKFIFVPRTLYRHKEQLMLWLANQIDLNATYIVPEGGANLLGVKGSKEIIDLITEPFDYIAVACGTGTTLAGICSALHNEQKALGFPALKGGSFLQAEVLKLCNYNTFNNFELIHDYHFGGYAKYTPELIHFIHDFYEKHKIKLDFIYTAKMMYGLFDKITNRYFPENTHIIAIHSGGLQGNQGIGL